MMLGPLGMAIPRSSVPVNLLESGRMATSAAAPPLADANMITVSLLVALPSLSGVPIYEVGLGLLVIDKGKEVSFPLVLIPRVLWAMLFWIDILFHHSGHRVILVFCPD